MQIQLLWLLPPISNLVMSANNGATITVTLRLAQPAPAERVSERPPPPDYVRTPLKGHVPYTESAGTAKVQPTLKTLEAIMRQLQSTMAHLKKDEQSSDSQQTKAYHASADTPDTEYVLHTYDGHSKWGSPSQFINQPRSSRQRLRPHHKGAAWQGSN